MAAPWEKYQSQPGAVPLTQGDPRRAPELQRTQAEAARAAAEAPYAGQTAAARAREAAAQATKAEIDARNAKEQWDTQHQPAGTSGIYGDDYLKTLHPSDQSMVKALKEGRLAFPQGAALRAPFWQEKLSQVAQYDPTFDATDYNARAKGRSNAIAGKLGVSNNNLNTAIGHAGKLYDQISGTASHNFTPLNAVENPFNRYILGDKGVTDFEQTAGLLADELEAAYRNGGGAEAGVVRQLRSFNTNASQDQKAGVIRNAIDLLSSKMQANLSQYNFGTGGKPAWDMLDPHTRDVLGAPQFSDIRDRYFAAPGAAPWAAAGASGGPGAGAPPAGPGGAPPPIPGGTPPSGATWRNMANAGPSYQAATGATRAEFDPVVAAQLEAMARNQRPPEEINAYLQGIKHTPIDPKIIQANEAYLKDHPDYAGFASATKDIPTSWWERRSAGPTAAYFNGAANGITLNSLGRIGGAASYLGGGDYTSTRDRINANSSALADTHPIANFAGNVTGGAMDNALGAGMLGRAAPGVAKALSSLPNWTRPTIGGAAYGGAYGAMNGNNPIEDGVGGLIMGGVGGLAGYHAATPIAALARRPLGAIANGYRNMTGAPTFSAPESLSPGQQMIANAATKAGPEDIRSMLAEAGNLNVPMSLADTHPQLTSLTGAAVRRSPTADKAAMDALLPRSRGQIDRFGQAIDTNLGPVGNVPQISEDLTKQAQTAAAPLYAKAYSAPPIQSEKLTSLLQTPAGKDGLRRAVTIAANEGRDPMSLGVQFDSAGDPVLSPTPSTQTLDYVKRGLDDIIEQGRNPLNGQLKLDEYGRSVNSVKNGLLSEMDRLNPDYAAARQAYAGPVHARDAMARGQAAAQPNVTPNELGVNLGHATPGDIPQMQLGYRSSLMDQGNRLRYSSNPFDATLGTPNAEAKLGAMYPDNPNVSNLLRTRDMEGQLARSTNDILGNSKTAQRGIADQAFGGESVPQMAVDAGLGLATGNVPIGAVMRAGSSQWMKDALKMGIGRRAVARADEIAPVLLNTDPGAASSSLDNILNQHQQYQDWVNGWRNRFVRPASGMFGSAAGQQSGQ